MEDKTRLYLIGNAHIDPAWLWLWQEGYSEVISTFTSALNRLDEFSDFVFTCSAAVYYHWIEEDYPHIFQRIKEYIQAGRWIVAGGWWVQPDCNMPCGESFVRHGLYGQRYFHEKFGLIAKTGYNVDSFGHNNNIPQLLRKCGMTNYVFQRPDKYEMELPSSLFNWQSMDGSSVLTARISKGYLAHDPSHLSEKIETIDKESTEAKLPMMVFYGVGNHGGGPTIELLEHISHEIAQGNKYKTKMTGVDEYFRVVGEYSNKLPVVTDDLQHHASGCYSAHSLIKQKFKQAEFALLAAESFAVLAYSLTSRKYPGEKIKFLWETVLFNSFHDILCGCSIKEVCDEAINQLGMVISESNQITYKSIQSISHNVDTLGKSVETDALNEKGSPVIAFNPLAWNVKMPVRIRGFRSTSDQKLLAYDLAGGTHAVQNIKSDHLLRDDKDALFMADIPAYGYKLYYLKEYGGQEYNKPADLSIYEKDMVNERKSNTPNSCYVMENKHLIFKIDKCRGNIVGIILKENMVNIIDDQASSALVIEDWENDTWAHQTDYFDELVGKFVCDNVAVIESGPVRTAIRTKSSYANSVLIQTYYLYAESKYIQVEVDLNWQEKHKILKLSLPIACDSCINTYQTPYSHIRKKCTGEEQVTVGWYDVTGENSSGKFGLMLASNAKYSFSAKNNEITMTAARSALYADHGGKRDQNEEYDYLDIGKQTFKYLLYPHKGEINPAAAVRLNAIVNTDLPIVKESFHKGNLTEENGYMQIDSEHVTINAIKLSEDNKGIVVRLHEADNQDVECKLTIRFPIGTNNMPLRFPLKFTPMEIKTILIHWSGELTETNMLENDQLICEGKC